MLPFADVLLASLARRLDATASRPLVRAMHLSPMPLNGRKDGEFGALELEDGSLGLSYMLLDDSLAALADGDLADSVIGADALQIAKWWRDRDGAARTVGFAAVNALSRHLFDRDGIVPPSAGDSIAGLDPQPGEHIGMVGFFPPLVKKVTALGARLTVLELRTDLAGDCPGYVVTNDPAALQACNKVLSTSTVLLNHSLDVVLSNCRHAQRIALVGPGAGCLPDDLFERGITTLGGSWITDPAGFKLALRQGRPWSAFAIRFVLHAAQWPPGDDSTI